jgi:hypothetical protein
VKEGVFDGPQIWQLIRDSTFTNFVTDFRTSGMGFIQRGDCQISQTFKNPRYKHAVKTTGPQMYYEFEGRLSALLS